MDQPPAKTLRRHLLAGLLLMVAAAVVVLLIKPRVFQPDGPQPPEAVGQLDLSRAGRIRNLAVAQVENLQFADADRNLQELAALLPRERLGFQNLAVVRLLRIQPEHLDRARQPEEYGLAVEFAGQAMTDLLARFPNDADSHRLAARLAEVQDRPVERTAALEKALALQPDDASLHFELFEALRYARTSEETQRAGSALKRVWELSPRNLLVMSETLALQAREKDTGLKATFDAAQTLVKPLAEKILQFGRVDLFKLIDEGRSAVDEGRWDGALRSAIMLSNMLKPEVATQNDYKRVHRHLLDFVQHDFSSDVREQIAQAVAAHEPSVPVKLLKQNVPALTGKRVKTVRMFDFDLDGTLDIAAVQPGRITVLGRIDGAEWKELAGFDSPAELTGMMVFDLDRDAVAPPAIAPSPEPAASTAPAAPGNACYDSDLDLVVFGPGGILVLRNELPPGATQRSLIPVNPGEGLAALRDVLAVLPVDFDHDGDLDLVVSARGGLSLWLNREDGTFVDHSAHSDLPPADAEIHSLVAVDWDRNVAIDVLCIGRQGAGYLENILHGRMRWQPFENGPVPVSLPGAGLAVVDADSSFSWDLLTAGDTVALHRTTNPDAGRVRFLEQQPLIDRPATGLLTWDFDNDGWQDVLTWQGSELKTLRGGPGAVFEPADELTQTVSGPVSGCDSGDIDGDGDIDLLVATDQGIELFLNEGGNANRWLDIPIRAEDSKQAQKPNERVNLHGVGSLIELRAGSLWQPQVVTGRSTHFGLGRNEAADSVRVLWTNGIPEHLIEPKSGVPVCLQQHLKGSCPYLYGWDGERFTFITDCLWAAPIGLQLTDGVQAPGREWEYLKVDGRFLQEDAGEYRLLMTEELWEVTYLESMRLLAVDHPADVEVYSNEKVGPPDISGFQVHTVKQKRTPVAARDQAGRDVLAKVAARDEDFVQCFDRRIKQGLTEPHYLELDLGGLESPRQILLFLTGWIRPTDTSLNIAISQWPDLEPTQPPSLQVPDANGKWVTVKPYMGFPGGKTKTIVINLTDVFPADDYRVRIASTMKLYWDEAFFTVDESPAEYRVTELPLKRATLRHHGFSAIVPHPGLGSDRYDFARISNHPKWPPLDGLLTTYGDVTELLRASDHRQVLLGAGDAVEVQFESTASDLPAGWTRDFILHNIGWDKDADINTVYGQTVDPLPFVGMNSYPATNIPDGNLPFADQTRRQPRHHFWRFYFDDRRWPGLNE